MKTIKVLVDGEAGSPIGEKYPLLFPEIIDWCPYPRAKTRQVRLEVVNCRMETGDYALEGFEHVGLVERKRGVRELATNLGSGDRGRFIRAIERLSSACTYPYLLLDCHPWEMYTVSEEVKTPWKVFDQLSQVIHKYGLRLLYAGGCQRPDRRRILGEQVVRLLLAHAYDPEEGIDRTEINRLLGLENEKNGNV